MIASPRKALPTDPLAKWNAFVLPGGDTLLPLISIRMSALSALPNSAIFGLELGCVKPLTTTVPVTLG